MSATHHVMVVGCGTMGSGIAQVAAVAGCSVTLYDAAPGAAARGRDRIAGFLAREVEKGRMEAAAREAALARFQIADSIEAAASQDVIIEAVRELLEVKQAIFAELEKHARPNALLLTNTSMISISAIAQNLQHPERVAGCHFFNPVPRMELVEVIPGERTTPETIQKVREMVTAWGKTAVDAPNTPGFIVNRAFCVMLNEATFLAEEGTAYEDIDRAMKLGCNFPMGPLELMDLVGIDVALDCIVALWEQYDRNPKYEPCELLRTMVAEGKLGRKSGQGFYSHAK